MKRSTLLAAVMVALASPAFAQFESTWLGGDASLPNAWDIQSTPNWRNANNNPDFYFDSDAVTFDDTANTFTVSVVSQVMPFSVTFDSATSNIYTLTGARVTRTTNDLPLALTGNVSVLLNGNGGYNFNTLSLPAGTTLTSAPTANETSITGDITGAGDINVNNGQLVLSGDNSGFTGTMTVNTGSTLNTNSANALAGTVIVNTGGVITAFNDTYTSNAPITLNGGRLALNGATSSVTFNGPITLTDNSEISGTGNATVGSLVLGTNNLNVNYSATKTLAVTGTLSGSGNLLKVGAGTLDLTSATNNLTGSILVNAGTLTAGGTYNVTSGQVLGGNGGTVIDNTNVQSGGKLAVGNGQLTGVNQISTTVTYVDAVEGASGNTFATGGLLNDTSWLATNNAGNSIETQWDRRSTFGNGGVVFQSSHFTTDGGGDSMPELTTQITGLDDGPYDVWVFFWDNNGGPNNWTISAGLTSGSLTTYSFDSTVSGVVNSETVLASSLDFVAAPMFTEATRTLYAVNLGEAQVSSGSDINVYIDNLIGGGTTNRVWYDGVGYGTSTVTFEDNMQALTIDGDFDLQTGSSLEIELLADNVFDKLIVTGQLTASGSLDVVYGDGTPDLEIGDTIDILDFGSIVGSFAAINLPTLAGGLAWNQSLLLTDGILSIVAAPDGLPGDFNGDGFVDAADYTVWRDNLGGDAAALGGNGSGAATVVAADYTLWRANFGNVLPPSGSLGGGTNVPEPASVLLTLVGGMALVALRRRR